MTRPEPVMPWWQVLLGGIATAAGVFILLWSIVIIGWALETVA
jgi:hypothetical protein